MATTAERRRELIAAHATETGRADVGELATQFGVTASTIRRDLARLSDAGVLTRTYGGAIGRNRIPEASLSEREQESYAAKAAIAAWAAHEVRAGEQVLLDAGSTVALLARRLPTATDLTVATASIPVLTALQGRPIDLVLLGGTLRPLSQAFVGPVTEATLEWFTFDRVFLGADGISTDGGICEAELTQTRLKELMAARSAHVYVLAHSDKLGRAPFRCWAHLPVPWTLVTDDGADPGFVEAFSRAGRTVITVPTP